MSGSGAGRRHLLVTNDFPPKVGGIQNYLWELWRRLDPDRAHVYTTPYPQLGAPAWFPGSEAVNARRAQTCRPETAAAFGDRHDHHIERCSPPVLLPSPWLAAEIDRRAAAIGAEIVLLDPALPLGLVGPRLRHPYGVVLHGAEVAIPARLPGSRAMLNRVVGDARLVVSAGEYALGEAEAALGREVPSVVVPPGVDTVRFRPPDDVERNRQRRRWGLSESDVAAVVVTRLVPRKGMDVLIDALAALRASHPQLVGLIGGTGRVSRRLEHQVARTGARVRLLGRLDDAEVVGLHQAGDLMAMPCTRRWGGLEQEGFGIVFLEAAACGLAQIAGDSGGAAEAVVDGETGYVVDAEPGVVADHLVHLADDPDLRRRLGQAARTRAVEAFDYDRLADHLQKAIDDVDLNGEARG